VVNVRYTFHEPEEEGVVTDCPHGGFGSTLVLSQRACEALEPMLDQAGALLRLNPPHEMGYRMFVCYRHIDALDTVRTKQGGVRRLHHAIRVPRRRPRRHGHVPVEQPGRPVLVSEHFVQEVRRHRLSGFRFRHLWSSDRGGVTLKDPVMIYERFPPGYGTTLREKRQAMRDLIASGR
jgi:hypothetical protein